MEMRSIRLKSVANIFEQRKKGGQVGEDNLFDESSVEFDDINLNGR